MQAKTEIQKIKGTEKMVTREFLTIHTIRSFAKRNFTNKTTLDEPDKSQLELLIESIDFKKKIKPKYLEKKNKKGYS